MKHLTIARFFVSHPSTNYQEYSLDTLVHVFVFILRASILVILIIQNIQFFFIPTNKIKPNLKYFENVSLSSVCILDTNSNFIPSEHCTVYTGVLFFLSPLFAYFALDQS